MELTSSRHGEALVVALAGSLDVVTADSLEQKLLEAINAGEKWLVLDLAHLDYVSSAGLRVFILVLKKIQAAGGRLRFCTLGKQVKQIFDIAGLSFRVELRPTLEEALKDFPPAH